MRRICLASIILAAFLHCAAPATDEDKARLFNTFYLDGDRVTYVLTMRRDRTFDLYGPDGSHTAGTVRADDDYVTLSAGGLKRYFRYSFKSRDLKLGCRENDKRVKGELLGELPPVNDFEVHTLYLSEGDWRKKGRPLFKPREAAARATEPSARVQEPVVGTPNPAAGTPSPVAKSPAASIPNSVPPATSQVPSTQPAVSFDDMAGTYYPNGKKDQCLVITANGCFGYVPVEGAAQNGTLLRTDNEISFVGPDHKRHFALRLLPSGFELTRRPTDVIKPEDVLGRMPPQGREAVVWMKAKEPGDQPAPAKTEEPVENRNLKVENPVLAPTPVRNVQAIVGTFVYKPNPFLAETLVIGEDGSFTYKDSNGANAAGKLSFEGDVLVFTAGEVVRRFTGALEGAGVTLTSEKNDKPSQKNDLASMSPTTLKTARYEKK